MIFSSNIFLFAFLPAVLCIYHVLPAKLKNLFLFLASVFFWFWGTGSVVLVFLVCFVVNYAAGRLMAGGGRGRAKSCLAAAVTVDLLLLIYFKYFGFLAEQAAALLGLFHITLPRPESVALPVGISFFTFEAISYVMEVFRGSVSPSRRLSDFGAYLGLFPHFIAGPIVRYSDVSDRLRSRIVTTDSFFSGVVRFANGLAKKVLLADSLGTVADKVFRLADADLTAPLAWLGIVCYTLQIYYDFSGYSDMAIGLGKFFGFDFPENFDQPYRAKNITEFWLRWHMTLSSWFRDFLFKPLGANRKGDFRTYVNLFLVFLLCGLWHGAAWTFVFWGVYHGSLIIVERALRNRYRFQMSGIPGNIFTFVLIMLGWVLFRSATLGAAGRFLGVMFSLKTAPAGFQFFPLRYYLQNDILLYLACALLFAWFPVERVRAGMPAEPSLWVAARGAVALVLMLYSAAVLSTVGFHPFIYFRF